MLSLFVSYFDSCFLKFMTAGNATVDTVDVLKAHFFVGPPQA